MRRPASAPASRAQLQEEPGRRGPTVAQLQVNNLYPLEWRLLGDRLAVLLRVVSLLSLAPQAKTFQKAKHERAGMIRATKKGLARAQGLSPNVRTTLSGEVPQMLGLRDFIVEANDKAGISPEQAAQRLQARLEKRVEHLVQREASFGQKSQRFRQRPHTAAPSGRSRGASNQSITNGMLSRGAKPTWSPTIAHSSSYDDIGRAATKRTPFPRGGGGRIGRAATSRRSSRRSRSLQLVPMDAQEVPQDQEAEAEIQLWEQRLQEQESNPDAGHAVFGVWSDACNDDVVGTQSGSTATSTPDTPPPSPTVSKAETEHVGTNFGGRGETATMDAAVRELAEAVRGEWGSVVVALRQAAEAAGGAAALSVTDIARVLRRTPSVSRVCDAAMITSIVHHIDAELSAREGVDRRDARKSSMGYIGLLQRLMSSLQPSKTLLKEDPQLQKEQVQTTEKDLVVSPAPWQTQKVEAVAAPKRQTQNFDKNAEVAMYTGVTQPYEKRIVRKRVMDKLKGGSLRHAFRDMDTDGNGVLSKRELREALWKLDIDMDDDDFDEMVSEIDTDGSGGVDFAEFKRYFTSGMGECTNIVRPTSGPGVCADATSAPVGVIDSMPLNQCVALIQDKVRARLQGGPAELRRTFQFFDTNRSGSIDRDEFMDGLKHRCGLVFAPPLMGRIWLHFTDGGGGLTAIDYKTFCRTVCCSSTDDDTTFNSASRSLSRATSHEMGNTTQFIRRKIREHWKDLCRDLHFAVMNDPAADGFITAEALRSVLYRHNIILQDESFASLALQLSDPGNQAGTGRISHERFLSQFGNGTPEDKLTSGVVSLATTTPTDSNNSNVKHTNKIALGDGNAVPAVDPAEISQAHRMLQDVLRGRLRSGPAELRRSFKMFDRSGDGKIDHEEWCFVLQRHLGLTFEQRLCDALFAKFALAEEQIEEDLDMQKPHQQSHQQKFQKYIDYHSFCQVLMESKSGGNSGTGLQLRRRGGRVK